ncbi:hypothetical protein H8A95_08865 [Bradyrhizobium sp. Pear76]|uniref:hypothetical protein n=1 Tax=Bradyrhizobium oropedii TaxID=1571201 RepID=UPI001E285449|nr:hypothetical protein [Bradyrhizobium oropedii]MCC8962430.1 hypothetical protein [Bradyrhizobium oropedii]
MQYQHDLFLPTALIDGSDSPLAEMLQVCFNRAPSFLLEAHDGLSRVIAEGAEGLWPSDLSFCSLESLDPSEASLNTAMYAANSIFAIASLSALAGRSL